MVCLLVCINKLVLLLRLMQLFELTLSAGAVPRGYAPAANHHCYTRSAELQEHFSIPQYLRYLLQPQRLELLSLQPQEQPHIVALCVDHALRADSPLECQQAASQAAAMGLQTQIIQMQWPRKPKPGHVMQDASIMRYRMLHEACRTRGISVLLLGHHAGICNTPDFSVM